MDISNWIEVRLLDGELYSVNRTNISSCDFSEIEKKILTSRSPTITFRGLYYKKVSDHSEEGGSGVLRTDMNYMQERR